MQYLYLYMESLLPYWHCYVNFRCSVIERSSFVLTELDKCYESSPCLCKFIYLTMRKYNKIKREDASKNNNNSFFKF